MSIRILIADDHGVMRAGLHALLQNEPGIEVIGEAVNGEETLQLAKKLLPDIVLLDIDLPDINGIEATRRIREISTQIQVLILTIFEDESFLREAIGAGAAGYIVKRAAAEELIAAIQAVSHGYMYIHPTVTHLLLKDLSPTVNPKKGALETLTPRELEVMGYIIRGYTNQQTAEMLCISVRTVEGHRANLFGKLNLKNRVELVEFAEKYGLME